MRRMGPSVWNIRLGSVVKYKSKNLGPSRKKTVKIMFRAPSARHGFVNPRG